MLSGFRAIRAVACKRVCRTRQQMKRWVTVGENGEPGTDAAGLYTDSLHVAAGP
ncbi:hypothetical protein C7S16_1573 [Burkholderia thailandensis]|uniref:Uncharacterized protein n=1 Tax=Burkholderia thailandensis TaxID=57975 RepID=A0AAW9D5U4_BURTH|nr:hypothetical protein [Burkholderia thailandensis]